MKSSGKIGLGLVALFVSGQVFAQVPGGYQVSWGAQGVPLSPWLNVLIVLMLALAAYVFLRRRAGGGIMLLVAALFVGGLSLYSEKHAISAPPIVSNTITTPSGSLTLPCSAGVHNLGTTVPEGVTLRVTPYFVSEPTGIQGAVTPSVAIGPQCTTGTHLNPGDICSLCVFG